MIRHIRRILAHKSDDEGASAVEYGLLVAAIAAVIIGIVFAFGSLVKSSFKDSCDALKAGAISSSGSCAEKTSAPVGG